MADWELRASRNDDPVLGLASLPDQSVDVILCDPPYAGSGTTGVACRALGRRFIGWESDVNMAEIARRRIAGDRAVPVEGQMEMF